MVTASVALTVENVNDPLDPIGTAQLESLDDTDALASAWTEALASAAADASTSVSWGGRGKGGRGLARRTVQPLDVVVDGVSLEYVRDDAAVGGGQSRPLLNDATLKLISPNVYALVGRNGCGKTTLLRRIDALKIPGFPSHLSTMVVPQEVFFPSNQGGGDASVTPLDVVLRHQRTVTSRSVDATRARIADLERELDALDVSSSEEDQALIETLCEQISSLEEELDEGDGRSGDDELRRKAGEALRFFGIDEARSETPLERLSGGLRKKVLLASALFCNPDILMLDEPTNHLDIAGILQLRRLIEVSVASNTTVLLVSHDIDLINDVATQVIHFFDRKLNYYPGNYRDFLGFKRQSDLHRLRRGHALEKQREAMLTTIDNLKKQSAGKRRGDKKKISRAIESRKKKLERHGLEKDEKGHRWTAQKAGTGIREGSIAGVDASSRTKLTHTQLLKRVETNVAPVPDKAVQFVFRDTTCTWGEPLIMALDVGHGYGISPKEQSDGGASVSLAPSSVAGTISKKPGMLFDCVDLCIGEGSRTCILGSNGSGKTTLLRILAGREEPLEGKIHRALNVKVGYFHQHSADDIIETATDSAKGGGMVTPLSLLQSLYKTKTEQDMRGELTSFGLDPQQATTNVKFLSGGERCRLCLAVMMLKDPHVLVLDEVTNHLDVESVEALLYGLKKWNGTVVLVSHDANFIRSMGGACYVLMEEEGKLRRICDGIDSYLKSFVL